MYDRAWSQSVVDNYQKLVVRSQQIDACVQQMYKERTGRECLRHDIRVCLVDSVQGRTSPSIWRLYKRVIKKTPLDKDLLGNLLNKLICKIDVEKLQRQFEWD